MTSAEFLAYSTHCHGRLHLPPSAPAPGGLLTCLPTQTTFRRPVACAGNPLRPVSRAIGMERAMSTRNAMTDAIRVLGPAYRALERSDNTITWHLIHVLEKLERET